MDIKLLLQPISFNEIPKNSIALDGAVRGCHLDIVGNRWSFDHHAESQPSISTRSTAMQVLLALRAGLDVHRIENVFVSSIDADSVIATSLVMRPKLAENSEVIKLVALHLDTVDSMGPAGALNDEPLAFHFTLRAGFKEELSTELLLSKVGLFFSLVEDGKLFELNSTPPKEECWLMSFQPEGEYYTEQFGVFNMGDLYKESNVGILFNEATGKVTIGAKSAFVTSKNFLEDGLFQRLNWNEEAKGGTPGWGGKDLIGGSPFKVGTKLSRHDVAHVFSNFLRGDLK
jgi:hypothetical protein